VTGQLVVGIPRVVTGQRTAMGGPANLAAGPVPGNLLPIERHLDSEDDGSDDKRAIAASIRNPMIEEITKNAINTPAAMAATLNQRISRFFSRKEPPSFI
jgi:hypothetical protein